MTASPMIDTHCHLNFDSYDSDRPDVVRRAAEAGVTRIIIPAVDIETGNQARALADAFPGIFASAGIHPNSTDNYTPALLDEIEAQAKQPKIVAIGEIGLDYYRDRSPKDKQAEAFEAQLELAAKLKLPVIIHNRDASDDIMPILEAWVKTLPHELKDRPGVMHSFSAPQSIADRALAAGFYLGFTGPITFGKADDLRRIACTVPLDHILVETDAPFLTPIPYRGKRNEPAYIPYMVERLASVKGIDKQKMAQASTENAVRLFHLPDGV